MHKLNIKWLRLVTDGKTCPRCRSTEEGLEEAVSALTRSLTPLGIQVILEKDELSLKEFHEDPLRSNQIWINGRLLEDWIGGTAGQSQCCDVCGDNECKTIVVGKDIYEVIPPDMIIRAGLLAASELVDTRAIGVCCGDSSSEKSERKCCSR